MLKFKNTIWWDFIYGEWTDHKIYSEICQKKVIKTYVCDVFILCNFITICFRIINPIVVAPTVAAVGLAFFSYGFPQAGTCMEISIPQIVLVLIFTLVSPPDPTISFLFIINKISLLSTTFWNWYRFFLLFLFEASSRNIYLWTPLVSNLCCKFLN